MQTLEVLRNFTQPAFMLGGRVAFKFHVLRLDPFDETLFFALRVNLWVGRAGCVKQV